MTTTKRHVRPLFRWLGALALLLVAVSLQSPEQAVANGVPMRIPLTYLSDLSTWGPQDARGEAELSFSEAFLRVDVRGLPVLSGETYQLWLVKSATNKAAAAGTLTSDGTVASFTGTLAGLDGYDYDLLMITVEPAIDPDPLPSSRRSLGGFFTAIKKTETAATIISDTRPAELPKTGEPAPASDEGSSNRLGLGLIAAGAGIVLFTVKRTRKQA